MQYKVWGQLLWKINSCFKLYFSLKPSQIQSVRRVRTLQSLTPALICCNFCLFLNRFLPSLNLSIIWHANRPKLYTSLVTQMVKKLSEMQETWVWSLGLEDSLEKGTKPTPVFLPGEFHGQRSLAGYSP